MKYNSVTSRPMKTTYQQSDTKPLSEPMLTNHQWGFDYGIHMRSENAQDIYPSYEFENY